MNILDTGEHLIEEGHSVLLIERGGKAPAYRFKDSPALTRDELRRRFRSGMNLAIRLEGLAGVDADDEPALRKIETMGDTPMRQITPRGEHRVFRLPEGIKLGCRQRLFRCGLDLKSGANSFLMMAPSYSQKHRRHYQLIGEIVPPIELPEFNPLWIEEARPPPSSLVSVRAASQRTVEWARKVLSEEYYSIEGCGGDTGLFKAACFLIQRARLDFNTAYALIQEWNHNGVNVIPPWDGPKGEARIRYKLREAQRLMR